jgi:hypothetical protein
MDGIGMLTSRTGWDNSAFPLLLEIAITDIVPQRQRLIEPSGVRGEAGGPDPGLWNGARL